MKNVILFIAALVITSCTNCDDDMPSFSNCNITGNVVIDNTQYQSITDDVFITDLQIAGDCLTVSISGSGCDASSWELNIIDEDNPSGSNPSMRHVALEFINPEACLAVFTKEFVFDLSSIQTSGSQVVLNFTNSGTASNQITYNY